MNSGFKTKNISHLSQKIHNILSTKTTTEYDEPEIPVMNYKWDTNREKDFRIKRKIKKNLYNEEIKCSNFLEIAFLPLVQENYISMKKDNDRMHILSRYAEGEWLTKGNIIKTNNYI